MIKYIFRQNKDYSRFNIIKQFTKDLKLKNDIYILLPFSKNQFFLNFFKRDRIINDFFISNFDTYVYDRKKITVKNLISFEKVKKHDDFCAHAFVKYTNNLYTLKILGLTIAITYYFGHMQISPK